MWRALCDDWATYLAEFSLSDVVISDAFFLLRHGCEEAEKNPLDEPLKALGDAALQDETDDANCAF